MPNPVFNISVDLTTKTASFTSGLSDAARAARGSFSDIKEGAAEMSRDTGYSMGEARHGVMMLGEEFGVHLPRGLTTFIASLGPIGAAMEAAFPFLAIVVGATLLLEHLAKLKHSGDELTESQQKFGHTAASVLNELGDKLLEDGIKADELSGNHLDALEKKLQLINHQSLRELGSEFERLSAEIDKTFATAHRGSLMTLLAGEGAGDKVKAEFDQFKAQYQSLLDSLKGSEARGLLVDEIIHAQEQLKHFQGENQNNSWVRDAVTQYQQLVAELEKMNQVQDKQSTHESNQERNAKTEDAEKAQAEQDRIDAVLERGLEHYKRIRGEEERATHEARAKEIKEEEQSAESKMKADDAFFGYLKKQEAEREKLFEQAGKIEAEHEQKMAELKLVASKDELQARMTMAAMTSAEILDAQMSLNAQEHALQAQALSQEIAALDQSDREYENKKKALQNKMIELDTQFYNRQNQLETQAQQKQAAMLTSWAIKQQDIYAEGFSKVLMGKESFVKMMQTADSQIASQAISAALQSLVSLETVQGRKRFGDARTAAADAFASAGNPILGAIEAGGAFAAVMALESGGIVPGMANFDSVPTLLTPGEAVLPKVLTENLMRASGDNSGSTHTHYHAPAFNPTIHALDSDGVDKVLTKHADTFRRHFENHLRRMNR